MCHFRPLFLYLRLVNTVDNRYTHILNKNYPMTGFEPRTSDVRSNPSANWATTTAQQQKYFIEKCEKLVEDFARRQAQTWWWCKSSQLDPTLRSFSERNFCSKRDQIVSPADNLSTHLASHSVRPNSSIFLWMMKERNAWNEWYLYWQLPVNSYHKIDADPSGSGNRCLITMFG